MILWGSLLFFAACGKNEPVTATGPGYPYTPYPQAPMPPNGGYQMPPNYTPTGGGGYNPYFYPQLPPGMPNQYTPWLPIDNYFRQNPTTVNIWVNIWTNWQGYANYNGYSPYDFTKFWFDFCPQQYPQYQPMWNYFDTNVYWWVDPYSQINCQQDPSYFWQYYVGYDYGGMNSYCGGYCY